MCVDIACEFCRSRDCDSGMKDDERPHRNVKNPPEISPTDFFLYECSCDCHARLELFDHLVL